MNIKQFIHKWKLGYALGILMAAVIVGGGKLAFDYIDNHSTQSQPCDIIYTTITITMAPGEEWYVGQSDYSYILDYDYYSANYTNGEIIASSNCFTDYPLHDVIKPGTKYVISKQEPLQFPFCIFENRLAGKLVPPLYLALNQTEPQENNATETIIITLEKCKATPKQVLLPSTDCSNLSYADVQWHAHYLECDNTIILNEQEKNDTQNIGLIYNTLNISSCAGEQIINRYDELCNNSSCKNNFYNKSYLVFIKHPDPPNFLEIEGEGPFRYCLWINNGTIQ